MTDTNPPIETPSPPADPILDPLIGFAAVMTVTVTTANKRYVDDLLIGLANSGYQMITSMQPKDPCADGSFSGTWTLGVPIRAKMPSPSEAPGEMTLDEG